MKKVLIVFLSLIIGATTFIGCNDNENLKSAKSEESSISYSEESSLKKGIEDEDEKVENKTETSEKENSKVNISKLKFGELLDVNNDDSTLIIKAKIKPSYSNNATISQNGYNVEDIILNKGGDLFDEIQYWAVADMTDGSESKVISFTLTKDQINAVKNKQILGNTLVENSTDLWILPSLQD